MHMLGAVHITKPASLEEKLKKATEKSLLLHRLCCPKASHVALYISKQNESLISSSV
jgi:hypothetical protein